MWESGRVPDSKETTPTKSIPANAAVWFEIPVTDMKRAKAFYGAVLEA
jgi:hypothetical protein